MNMVFWTPIGELNWRRAFAWYEAFLCYKMDVFMFSTLFDFLNFSCRGVIVLHFFIVPWPVYPML